MTYDVRIVKGQKYPDVLSFWGKHVGKERTERRNGAPETLLRRQDCGAAGGWCGVCFQNLGANGRITEPKGEDVKTTVVGSKEDGDKARSPSSPGDVVRAVLRPPGRQGCPGRTLPDRRPGLQSGQRQLRLRQRLPKGDPEEGHVLRRRRLLHRPPQDRRCLR